MTFSILSLPLTFHTVNAKKVWFSHGTEINSKIWNDSISVCYNLWSHFSGTTLAALMLWPDLCLSVSWGLIFIYVYKSLILKQTLFPLLTATYPFQDSRRNWKKENPEELRKTSWKTWGAAEHNHSDVPSRSTPAFTPQRSPGWGWGWERLSWRFPKLHMEIGDVETGKSDF